MARTYRALSGKTTTSVLGFAPETVQASGPLPKAGCYAATGERMQAQQSARGLLIGDRLGNKQEVEHAGCLGSQLPPASSVEAAVRVDMDCPQRVQISSLGLRHQFLQKTR